MKFWRRSEAKSHIYYFSYMSSKANAMTHACCYVGLKSKRVSKDLIDHQKQYAGVPDDAVLISCGYLGRMTMAEFTEPVETASDS